MNKISLTKEGKRFLIAVALIGFASVNTGNNLIYLIFSMMLSLLVISFVIAAINLRKIECTADFEEPLYANTPFEIKIAFHNKKIIPSYSIAIVFPLDISRQLYIPVIKKGRKTENFYNVLTMKRGRYFLEHLKLRTGFPFVFMNLYKDMDYGKELIVYPEIIDVSSLLKDIPLQSSEREGMRISTGGDFLLSREYVYGEESKNIDWKATARTQKTMVKEFSMGDNLLSTIILDNSSDVHDSVFEKAVSITASLCSVFVERDYYVRLITCGKVVPFGKGKMHLFKILDILAGIQTLKVTGCTVDELKEGMNILILSSENLVFSGIASQCSGIIDARYI
ncbi:MAG: DUF58 domain-containing protein [Nitrospirae bacterium]|nr:DUF58 domain-containing protein [Nitrospirota bacterium]